MRKFGDIEVGDYIEQFDRTKSAKDLASLVTCSVRTMKDKYLTKMLQTGVITMTILDKPTSSKQKYKLVIEE